MAFDNFRGRTLAPETAANNVDVSVSQVHRWIKDGKIKVVKLGYRMTRIDGDSLADFLTAKLTEPRPPRGKAAKASTAELASQA